MSDSSVEESDGPIVLCSNCRARVVLTEPKEKLSQTQAPTSRQQSTATVAPPKKPSEGQRQKMFDKLGPQKQTDGPTSVRRYIDFDASFYNEDYYSRNSISSSSSGNKKTFKPPEPRDQRWYSYNSPTGMYIALSKSKKRQRQRQRIDFFLAVSLFDLTTDEKDRVTRLDTYLDTRDARISYEERARKTLQEQSQALETNGLNNYSPKETRLGSWTQEQVPVETPDHQAEDALMHDVILLNNSEDDDQDPMGPSVLENMEISMVHVLPAEFQPTTH
ncbi:hypothetical protein ACFX19_024863 [Malus domestica]